MFIEMCAFAISSVALFGSPHGFFSMIGLSVKLILFASIEGRYREIRANGGTQMAGVDQPEMGIQQNDPVAGPSNQGLVGVNNTPMRPTNPAGFVQANAPMSGNQVGSVQPGGFESHDQAGLAQFGPYVAENQGGLVAVDPSTAINQAGLAPLPTGTHRHMINSNDAIFAQPTVTSISKTDEGCPPSYPTREPPPPYF